MGWKMATFNVNGVRARLPLLLEWLEEKRPDVACLQEIKCRDEDFPAADIAGAGYRAIVRGQKSFNGVAILHKDDPQDVWLEFGGGEPLDPEARFLAARFGKVWVINTYVPQGRDPDDPAFAYKLDFIARIRAGLEAHFTPGDPLVWTGDINVAPEPIDVFDPKRMEGQTGFHPEERKALAEAAGWGLTDLYRHLHPDEKQFTFWDYRLPKSFQRNLGWRIDHFLATRSMADCCLGCEVDMELRGKAKPSDHTAVMAEFDLEALPG